MVMWGEGQRSSYYVCSLEKKYAFKWCSIISCWASLPLVDDWLLSFGGGAIKYGLAQLPQSAGKLLTKLHGEPDSLSFKYIAKCCTKSVLEIIILPSSILLNLCISFVSFCGVFMFLVTYGGAAEFQPLRCRTLLNSGTLTCLSKPRRETGIFMEQFLWLVLDICVRMRWFSCEKQSFLSTKTTKKD